MESKDKDMKFIGIETIYKDNVKRGFKSMFKNKHFLSIYLNEKTGEVSTKSNSMKDLWADMRTTLKPFKDDLEDDKPVDTSNWVRPDRESLKHALIKRMVLFELYEKDSISAIENDVERKLLYSILYSHSPNNPQSLTNFYLSDNLSMMYRLTNNKEHEGYVFKLIANKEPETPMDELREQRKRWYKARIKEIFNK